MNNNVDRSKLFIISVDGLDVSGKETFCKNLKMTLISELADKNLLNVNVSMVSFPRYETKIGSDIKKILNMNLKDRESLSDHLEELFKTDRITFFNDYFENVYDDSKMNIIICDRYSFSNYIYSHLKIMNEFDIPTRSLFEENEFRKLSKELEVVPVPDLTVIFNRITKESEIIHRNLLEEKSDKDKNETESIQKYLSDVIKNDLIHNISKLTKKLLVIPIGSNYGSSQIEKGISTLVISKMIENGMDSIVYPSSIIYKNNETLNLVGDLNFLPSVHINFLVNKDETMIDKFKKDAIKAYKLKRALDRIASPEQSYFERMGIKLPEQFENDPFYASLVESFANDLNILNIDKEKIESFLDTKIEKEILTPKKNSKLDCNYSLLTPKTLIVPSKSVKSVDFGVEIHSIESISKRTMNRVIDLDIKTSKECILNYGVGVADSPSSISSDFKGTLSVILVNHTDKDAVIPFGFPIASLVVKDSSCETLFTIVK